MSKGVIDYQINQERIRNLRSRFVIFSVIALAVIVLISFIAFNFHKNIILQQKSIRKIYKLLNKQQNAINQISSLGGLFDEEISSKEMISVQQQVKKSVSNLKSAGTELSSLILKNTSASLEDLEEYLIRKKIRSKIRNYTSHVKTLLNDSSTPAEIKKSIQYISQNSSDGDTEYINELIEIIDLEYKSGMKLIENMGLLIIFLCLLEILIAWIFLFRPLNSTVLAQNKELLESALKVESASRSKTDFLANISHEIRTPMTAILGYTEILQNQSELDRSKVDNAVSIINKNASHLLGLLDEVLDVSKMESSKFELIPEKINLSQLLNEVYSLINIKASEKKLNLIFSNLEAIPKYIYTDPKRLKQILFNIIGNAIKFTNDGYVKLTVKLEHNRKLCFEVVDTGCGIPKEKLKIIFEPFEQAYTAPNRQFAGTGLGLVLSRGLTRKMGGDLKVLSSELGKGSTFLITIDPGELGAHTLIDKLSTSITPSGISTIDHNEKPLNKKKILVVDDAKENARLFSMYLENSGAVVEVLNEGFSVVEIVKDRKFDLILLDLQMPGMDGYQVIKEIQKNGYTGKVSALTAHAMSEEIKKTKDYGFHAHITKPISSEKLIEKILLILG